MCTESNQRGIQEGIRDPLLENLLPRQRDTPFGPPAVGTPRRAYSACSFVVSEIPTHTLTFPQIRRALRVGAPSRRARQVWSSNLHSYQFRVQMMLLIKQIKFREWTSSISYPREDRVFALNEVFAKLPKAIF